MYLPNTLLELLGPDMKMCRYLFHSDVPLLMSLNTLTEVEATQVGDTLLARGWVPSVLVLTSPGVDQVFLKSTPGGGDNKSFPASFTDMLCSAFSKLNQKCVHLPDYTLTLSDLPISEWEQNDTSRRDVCQLAHSPTSDYFGQTRGPLYSLD